MNSIDMFLKSGSFPEINPEELGKKFNEDPIAFTSYLRQETKKNPSIRFNIIAEWKDVHRARAAKGILDSGRYPIDSFAIKATKEQYMEDVNAFQSGVKWIEVNKAAER